MLMKKLILAIAIGIVSIASYAQTVTNADGSVTTNTDQQAYDAAQQALNNAKEEKENE